MSVVLHSVLCVYVCALVRMSLVNVLFLWSVDLLTLSRR